MASSTDSDGPKAGRRRGLVRLIAVNLAVLLALLVVVELGLRLFAPILLTGDQRAYQWDEELGFRLKPGRYVKVSDHRQEFFVNSLGTVNFQESFDDYGSLVFALGDSYTQGTGNPPTDAYPFRLDLLLNVGDDGAYRRDHGVVNLGLAAYGGRQSALAYERYRKQIGEPAWVLYLGCKNDALDDRQFAAGVKHGSLVDGNPKWGPFVRPLQAVSKLQLVTRLKLALAASRNARLAGPDGGDGEAGPSSAEQQWPVIVDLAERVRSRGGQLIVSWVPDEASYDWLRERAATEGVAFADWYPAALEVTRSVDGLPLWNDHSAGHFRPWVYQLIAEEYAREMGLGPLARNAAAPGEAETGTAAREGAAPAQEPAP